MTFRAFIAAVQDGSYQTEVGGSSDDTFWTEQGPVPPGDIDAVTAEAFNADVLDVDTAWDAARRRVADALGSVL